MARPVVLAVAAALAGLDVGEPRSAPLVGLEGGTFKAYFNGREKGYNQKLYPYDPTPSSFTIVPKGDTPLIIEITKTAGRNEPVKVACNLCDFDGDRLEGLAFVPENE